MNYKISSDQSTAVSLDEAFQPMETCPRNVKVQTLTTGGIACYSIVTDKDAHMYMGWAPVPARSKKEAEPLQAVLQVTISATCTYKANQDFYPNCKTAEEMLAVDVENADGDPFLFLSGEDLKWSVSGKVVKDSE